MYAVYATVILSILCISDALLHKTRTTTRPKKDPECGVSSFPPNAARIVGGEEARPHSWPWQVSITCLHPSNDSLVYFARFGGSIITQEWIITCAHGLYRNGTLYNVKRDCKILLGKHNLRIRESTQVEADIAKYVIHKKYDPAKSLEGYDLALIQITKPVKFNYAIQSICLPFGLPELPVGKTCYSTGWGRTALNASLLTSTGLKQLSMNVQEELYCNFTEVATGRVICTGKWNRGENNCIGDSGGPLHCQEPDDKYYLRGVGSKVDQGCRSVSTFIKVSVFQEWIEKTITSN